MALIHGISFEFIDCLLRPSSGRDIISANHELIAQLSKECATYDSTTVFIGSFCQSIREDRATSDLYGSIFPPFLHLAEHLGAKADKFLLASLYNDLPNDEIFDRALRCLAENSREYRPDRLVGIPSYDWLYDSSKLTIIYAQVHKLASENQGSIIHFSFYDKNHAILDELYGFFQRNPDLLPQGLQLQLVHYNGAVASSSLTGSHQYPSIKGNGVVNPLYHLAVKEIAADCIASPRYQSLEPSGREGKRIRNYLNAQAEQFYLSTNLNCALDYKPFRSRDPYYQFHKVAHLDTKPLLKASEQSHTQSCPSFFSMPQRVSLAWHRSPFHAPLHAPSPACSSSIPEPDGVGNIEECRASYP